MNAPFQAVCEAAATAWDVPALAAGTSVGGERRDGRASAASPTTLFRVASITKPFTATLALELLDLEAATGVWPADVRVRHLLSHTSGYDCELRRPGARSATATTRSRPSSPSCPACAGSSASSRRGRTRTPATGSPGHLAARAGRDDVRGCARRRASCAPRARVDVVRRAGARRHRPRRAATARTRAPAARRAGSSRTSPTSSASAGGSSRSRRRRGCASPHGKPIGGRLRARSLRRARRRRRGLGPRRLVRRLPVARSSSCPTATRCSSA